MKKILSFFCVPALVLSMASCSGDDKDDVKPFNATTFTEENGLNLTMNDEPVLGKTAVFTPNSADPRKATITLSSSFDLSNIPNIPATENPIIAGPGVVLGSKTLTLDVDLTYKTNVAEFSGKKDAEYCTFDYSGTVNNEALVLNIKNVELKNKAIVGLWTPRQFKMDDDWESETYGQILTNPAYVVWESSSDFNFLGSPTPIGSLVGLLFAMPLINDLGDTPLTVSQALNAVLKDVEFMNDGNLVATYLDTEAATPAFKKSPLNIAQYVLTGNTDMRFYLNPQAIMAVAPELPVTKAIGASRAIDINNLFGNVLAQLIPMMGDGVPMHYSLDGSDLRVYLGTELLLPLLKQVSPLLRDQAVIDQVVDLVKDDPSMSFLVALLPTMITSLADVIDNTTKIEIGLNLSK